MPVWLVTWFLGGGWKYLLGALVIALVAASYGYAWTSGHSAGVSGEKAWVAAQIALEQDKTIKTNAKAIQTVSDAAKITNDNIGKVHESVRTVKEYIYVHPPASTCKLPAYLQRMYDASGTGDQAYLAADGSDPDSSTQDVPCDQAGQILSDNNEAFRANSEQLKGLQKAYSDLRTLYNQGN
jgi:uncharacterized membrane protein YtjA (UPF0391 family)